MIVNKTEIQGLFVIDYSEFKDKRGSFVKTIHEGLFEKNNLSCDFRESFFSISQANVIRGMHFQVPPDDHAKLVYVICGEIIDVVLDIRKKSDTYGQFWSIRLGSDSRKGVYIEKGLAHGFLSLTPNTIVEYHTTTVHSPLNETGIHYNSFGFGWPTLSPIVSDRDESLSIFANYNSPF